MDVREPGELAALAASPLAAELLDDVVVVDLRAGAEAGVDLAPLTALPVVVVGIGPGPCPEVDVLVDGEDGAEAVVDAATARPVAATALVLHLRASAALPIGAALVGESATYSALQGGAEHLSWLAARDATRAPGRSHDGGARVRVAADPDEPGRLHIALARPGARNAVDAAMQLALVDALAAVGPDVAELVITGDGPVFSAGGDLDEFGALADPASAHLLRLARSPARALARVADRTTVVVQGACHGAGVELPAFARRVVARPDATFTLPEVAMGLIPGAGGTVSLPRRIGRQRTAWLALTGAPIDAATARDWGLVDEVADDQP
ncbi:MAG TPA: enoyl-CoA hydratase/isomerase family protein [Acidimicrobiales bacterium]|nr:enoyl-CoA hydratase/isomerase family protein [Acidimicrobiales bacterium]